MTRRSYISVDETGLYYLQSRYYNPTWGRFLNADAYTSTGQGMLGNNMFAYCRNNPVIRMDSAGQKDENTTEEDDPLLKRLLANMFRKRENGHTFSVGLTYGASWGGFGAGKSAVLSVDNSYNYAFQTSDTLTTSTGGGASGGICFTYTNANDVQDLSGASKTMGITLCSIYGISIDYVSFSAATNPEKECWGISVSLLLGAEAETHTGESYTPPTKSWNPFKALYEWLFGDDT